MDLSGVLDRPIFYLDSNYYILIFFNLKPLIDSYLRKTRLPRPMTSSCRSSII
jgi:hypothetical protein